MIKPESIKSLQELGYGFEDDFISESLVSEVVDYIDRLPLKPAGVGRGGEFQVDQSVRGDFIKWLENEAHPIEARLLSRLDEVRNALNRSCFLGLRDYEGHLTRYPAGAHYDKHWDNFKGRSNRVLSMIIYLNQQWHPQDGGELILYHPDHPEEKIEAVAPKAGRLAFFLAESFPHEVLPMRKPRYSITGWFRN